MSLKTTNVVQRKTAHIAYFGVGFAHLPQDTKVQALERVVKTVLENGVRGWLSSSWQLGKMNSLLSVTNLFHDSNNKKSQK